MTDEQRSSRPICNATLRAAASWLFFLVTRSIGMIQIAALRSHLEKQQTDLRRNSRDSGDGTPRRNLSAGISLAVLAVGFTLLGLLSLTNRRHEDLLRATVLENTCCVMGGVISIVAGTIFLLAGWIYWSKMARG